MTLNKLQHADTFSATATHATEAVASKAGATDTLYYVTTVTFASDKAGANGIVKQGTTTIWETLQGANTTVTINFDPPLRGVSGGLVSATVDGTSVCKANIAGYSLPS